MMVERQLQVDPFPSFAVRLLGTAGPGGGFVVEHLPGVGGGVVVDPIDPRREFDRHAIHFQRPVFDVLLGGVDHPAFLRPAGLHGGKGFESAAGQFRLHRHGRRGA